jgi:hypothetical protein
MIIVSLDYETANHSRVSMLDVCANTGNGVNREIREPREKDQRTFRVRVFRVFRGTKNS